MLAFLLLILPSTVLAFSVNTNNTVFIGENDVIEGNLYAAGQSITVDGHVKGDIFCAGRTVIVNGLVDGDVICVAEAIVINGEVGGSVRVAGNAVSINSNVARNVQAVGASVTLSSEANVGWDMFLAGVFGEIHGKVNGDLHGVVEQLIINGEIGKDVRVRLCKECHDTKTMPLVVNKDAVIHGNLYYTSSKAGSIKEGATINGETGFSFSDKKHKKHTAFASAWEILFSVFSSLLIGLVLISFWRKEIKDLTNKMLAKKGASIGWGAIVMFLTPIIALILLFTLIGIPLAAILIGVWLIAICISKILVGILIGRSMLEKFYQSKKDSLIIAMIIGVTILCLLSTIPFIGWIICLTAIWWGLGGIYFHFKKCDDKND